MRLEFIDKVKANDILGKNVLSNDGKILLSAGLRLDCIYIKKLKELGIFCIYIEDERLEDVKIEKKKFSELKQLSMKNMSNIMKNVYGSGDTNIREVASVVEDLIDCIIGMGDVSKSLHDIQDFDNLTYFHSIDTCIMSSFLGIASGIDKEELVELGLASMLHDIGKTKVPRNIVCKAGPLTNDEYTEMQKHAIYGVEVLSKGNYVSKNVIEAVGQHHERYDGRGYPYGLKGEQISKHAKLIGICDVFDAVSSDRSYRAKISPGEAYKIIIQGSGSFFDGRVVENFRKTFAVYPLGSCVKLSNEIEGYVIKQNSNFPDKPVIRVLYDNITRRPVPFYEIDLLNRFELNIKDMVV